VAHAYRGVRRAGADTGLLAEARNLVLVGANGLGKTMIAQNICHAAVLAGHSVLFRTASRCLEELHRQTPGGRLRKLRAYANVALLVHRRGRVSLLRRQVGRLLYEVINRRYEQKSLILTTNKPFKNGTRSFPTPPAIATALDRLLHHAEVTVIEGSSYRVRESEQRPRPAQEKEMNHPDASASYVASVVTLYLECRTRPCESASPTNAGRHFHEIAFPLETVETALRAGLAAPTDPPADAPRLSPIRSLAYFRPVIENSANTAPENYREYLRLKLRQPQTLSPMTGKIRFLMTVNKSHPRSERMECKHFKVPVRVSR